MKTSLIIRDEVYQAARHRAVESRRTISDIVETALRDWLASDRKTAAHVFIWKPVRGRSVPAVNVDDRESLYDVMEGRE